MRCRKMYIKKCGKCRYVENMRMERQRLPRLECDEHDKYAQYWSFECGDTDPSNQVAGKRKIERILRRYPRKK